MSLDGPGLRESMGFVALPLSADVHIESEALVPLSCPVIRFTDCRKPPAVLRCAVLQWRSQCLGT